MKSEKRKKKNLLILGAALLSFHFSLRGFSFRGRRSVVGRVAMIDGIMRSAIFICFGTYPFFVFGDTEGGGEGRGLFAWRRFAFVCTIWGIWGFSDLGERIGFFLWSEWNWLEIIRHYILPKN